MRARSVGFFAVVFLIVPGCSEQTQSNGEPNSADVVDGPIPESSDNLSESIAHARRSLQLEVLKPKFPANFPEVPPGGGVESAGWQSKAFGQGHLLQRSEKDPVIFAGNRCMRGGSCGCDREMPYFFGKAPNGHIAVLVPQPNVHTQTVKRSGSCGYGCGQPSPPQPPAYFELPVTDMGLVELVEVPFELNEVIVTCENPMPRP